MVLGDAEETVTTVEIDEETYEEVYKTTKRTIPMLFVRGDGVILGKSFCFTFVKEFLSKRLQPTVTPSFSKKHDSIVR